MPISVPGPPSSNSQDPVTRDPSPSFYWLVPILGIPMLILIGVLLGKVY